MLFLHADTTFSYECIQCKKYFQGSAIIVSLAHGCTFHLRSRVDFLTGALGSLARASSRLPQA